LKHLRPRFSDDRAHERGAIEHVRSAAADIPLGEFKADWRNRWLVERGV
jgi:hypothetical protein